MRYSSRLAVLAGVVGVALLVAPTAVAQRFGRFERQTINGRDVIAREVLVRFRDPVLAPDLAAIAADTDAQEVERVGRAGALRLRSRSLGTAALLARLAQRSDVLYAEPNFIIQIQEAPNDPYFPLLWGLDTIQATPAWDLSVGSPANIVAVIDTGIDYTHPDLAANIWSAPTPFTVNVGGALVTCAAGTHGFNAITRSCDPMDDHDHGTHVAGTIGAVGNNGVGVAGVNWTAGIMGIKFLDANGSGTVADAIASVEFAMAAKQAFAASGAANIRVLSNSWGGPEFSQALLDQVNAANEADMLVVAGSGNDGFDNDILPFYPASFDAPNVVSVASTGEGDALSYFSNYGVLSVHLAAPGEFILSTIRGGDYNFSSGTSMATPHVSGAAALVLSRCDIDTAALKETLLATADRVPGLDGYTVTGGRLNVNQALNACIAPPATPTGLTARGNDQRITLSWSAALGAMRYTVKRSLVSGGPYAIVASDVQGTTFVDDGLVNGTTYYYVVSAENTLGESGDSDEASATPNIPPDLIIYALVAPAVAAADAQMAVTVTTKNQGAGNAQPSTTRFYLSGDNVLDPSDAVLNGIQAVPALAPGADATTPVSLHIPDVAAGKHYLIVLVDADDVLDENSETNNRLSRAIQIGPDLFFSTLTVPAAGAAGSTITVTDTVSNGGGGPAQSSTTTFYLSVNNTIGVGDVLLGNRPVPAIAAGAANSGTTALPIPPATAMGTYYILAMADASDVVSETSEINNTLGRLLQIGGDLMVSGLTLPISAAPGSQIVVTDTTKNRGGGATPASVTRFYFSSNLALDAADILLDGGRDVPPLEPNATSTGPATVMIPANAALGTNYIIAKADGNETVAEVYETNNTYGQVIQIGSDLVISALTVPAKAAAGATIGVNETTGNVGAGAASPSVTRFYLSLNAVLDASDVLLPGVHQVPQLVSGASSQLSLSLTIPPATASGSYFLIAGADADHAVVEIKENNNTLAKSIQIGGDLVVSAFTVPTKGGAGLPMVVNDTTTNQGGAPVGPTITNFYLSVNAIFDASDTLLGSRGIGALADGTSSAGPTTVTIPPGTVTGSYYIIARADAEAVVAETLETNNALARPVQIGGDLWVTTMTAPAKAAGGSVIVVTDTTVNQGGGLAAASVTTFYLSANGSLDAGDVLLDGARNVPELPVGGSSTGSADVAIPAGTAAGTFYLIAKADGTNQVSEAQESNNTRSRAISIGPDLVVYGVAPATVAAGGTMNVTDTVTNQGAGVAAGSMTRFYLSKNALLDASDILLAPGRTVPPVDVATPSTGTTEVMIPAGTVPGAYILLTKTDADNTVGESLETNNVSARGIQVTTAP